MPVRVSKHTPQVKAAKYRKWKGNFIKITGGAFDEAWDPSVDRNGSFAQDQLKHFTKLAGDDPSKLEAYYNEKRADVIKAHNEGKNLVDYGRDENGKLVHFLENRDGQLNFAAQEFNKGGNQRLEQAKNNIINQARERVILGLATKADLKELYRYDHAGPVHQNSVKEQLDNAFEQLFDSDFFDGFRYGFGSVLQLGAPLFDYVPGGEGASEYIDEAGKFIQGDIDSVDTIINRQNLRAEKRDPGGTYENDIVKRAVPFDPAAAQADDVIRKEQAREAAQAEQFSGDKLQEYNDAAVASYKQSQGLTDEQYDKIALPDAEFKKKYAQPPAEHMAPENVDTTPTPLLPEGEEFKQAPLEEVNDRLDNTIASQGPQPGAPSEDLAAINTKLDKLQSSVDGIIGRAKARKAKHQSGGSIHGSGGRPGGAYEGRQEDIPAHIAYRRRGDIEDLHRIIRENRVELVQSEQAGTRNEVLRARIGHLQDMLVRVSQHMGHEYLTANAPYLNPHGGALGNKKRKPGRDISRDKPISPADKAELARLEEEFLAAQFDNDDPEEADRVEAQINAILAKYGGMHRDPRDYEVGGTVKRKRDYTPSAPASRYDPATERRLTEIEQRLYVLMNQGNIYVGPNSEEIRRLFEEQRDLSNVLDMQDRRNNNHNVNRRGLWRR